MGSFKSIILLFMFCALAALTYVYYCCMLGSAFFLLTGLLPILVLVLIGSALGCIYFAITTVLDNGCKNRFCYFLEQTTGLMIFGIASSALILFFMLHSPVFLMLSLSAPIIQHFIHLCAYILSPAKLRPFGVAVVFSALSMGICLPIITVILWIPILMWISLVLYTSFIFFFLLYKAWLLMESDKVMRVRIFVSSSLFLYATAGNLEELRIIHSLKDLIVKKYRLCDIIVKSCSKVKVKDKKFTHRLSDLATVDSRLSHNCNRDLTLDLRLFLDEEGAYKKVNFEESKKALSTSFEELDECLKITRISLADSKLLDRKSFLELSGYYEVAKTSAKRALEGTLPIRCDNTTNKKIEQEEKNGFLLKLKEKNNRLQGKKPLDEKSRESRHERTKELRGKRNKFLSSVLPEEEQKRSKDETRNFTTP